MPENPRQKTALISVYDKTGIAEFAKELVNLGWKILSSGGTAKALSEAGVKVEDVANIVGGGAILGHRVVTLSREIHAGLLANDNEEDRKELENLKVPFIDLVCCDFYPLQNEVTNPEATTESVIEKTDIGGPTMIRSGAKGGRITICDPADRTKVIEWLKGGEENKEEFLNKLRAKAEFVVARYVATSAFYHSGSKDKSIFGELVRECAYGENAYQKPAGLYENLSPDVGCLDPRRPTSGGDALAVHKWELVAGNPMSYNNFCDLDRMMQTMTHIGAGFEKNFSAIPDIAIGAKHGNACGAGVAESGAEAVDKMLGGDLRAIFGGSVMLNFPVDENIAEELINRYSPEGVRRLLDVVAAPSFTPEAIEILARKKGKCRILVNKNIEKAGMKMLDVEPRQRYVRGGFLLQPNYTFVPSFALASEGRPAENSMRDAILAWAVGSTSNSNTITIVKDGRLYGNGVGQQDRVGAAKLAIFRADEAARFRAEQEKNYPLLLHPAGGTFREDNSFLAPLEGATAYSDSFFPFPDAPEALISRGIKTIFSTSGSVNDEKVIALCQERGVELILLPDAEARGFYQH